MANKLFAAVVKKTIGTGNIVKFFVNPETYTDSQNRNYLVASTPKKGFWAKNSNNCDIVDLGYSERVPAPGVEYNEMVAQVESVIAAY